MYNVEYWYLNISIYTYNNKCLSYTQITYTFYNTKGKLIFIPIVNTQLC